MATAHPACDVPAPEVSSGGALDRFLADVEKRAFHIARYATRDSDEALDIVQDCMLTLARKYGRRPESEWRPLFYRILKNRITDWHRRTAQKRRWFNGGPADDGENPLESAPAPQAANPEVQCAIDGATRRLTTAVADLPRRQREAFLLRALEGFGVAETAKVMGCTAGSVKTHYSRALNALREALGDHWQRVVEISAMRSRRRLQRRCAARRTQCPQTLQVA